MFNMTYCIRFMFDSIIIAQKYESQARALCISIRASSPGGGRLAIHS